MLISPDLAPRSALGQRRWSPRGAATEVTNGKVQPWAYCGQAGLGLVDAPGSTFLAGRWGQPQADAWPTCADGASRVVPGEV